jgi:hypothetical protein
MIDIAKLEVELDSATSAAEQWVRDTDRRRFIPYFAKIEEFISDNGLIMSGETAIARLTRDGSPPSLTLQYEIFSDDPYTTGVHLTNALFDIENLVYIYLRTDIKFRELSIIVDCRELVKLRRVERFNNIPLSTIIPGVGSIGHFGNDIVCMSPTILLANVYQALYSPSRFTKDKTLLEKESELWRIFTDRNAPVIKNSAVAARAIRATQTVSAIDEESRELISMSHITGGSDGKDDIYSTSYGGGDSNGDIQDALEDVATLIGDWAVGIDQPKRLQFLTSLTVQQVIKRIQPLFRAKVTYKRYTYFNDFQLVKHTIFRADTAVCDIFNSPTYELIPVRDGRPAGWVLMRFYALELMTLEIISAIQGGATHTARIAQIRDIMVDIRQRALGEPFQLDGYIGVCLNDTVQRKKIVISQDRIPHYYPVKGRRKLLQDV